SQRAVGEIVAAPTPGIGLGEDLLTGFENHRGGTTLGSEAAPLARVLSGVGNGNGAEGVVAGHIVGTYLHGPVLARNPALADYLLSLATGQPLEPLHLDDVEDLRRDRLTASRARPGRRMQRLSAALVPRRWLSPGMPAERGSSWPDASAGGS